MFSSFFSTVNLKHVQAIFKQWYLFYPLLLVVFRVSYNNNTISPFNGIAKVYATIIWNHIEHARIKFELTTDSYINKTSG